MGLSLGAQLNLSLGPPALQGPGALGLSPGLAQLQCRCKGLRLEPGLMHSPMLQCRRTPETNELSEMEGTCVSGEQSITQGSLVDMRIERKLTSMIL